MGRNLNYSISSNTRSSSPNSTFQAVRVCDIILETSDKDSVRHGGVDSIGTIFFSDISINKGFEFPRKLPTAKPLFSYHKYVPLINEIVLLLQINSNDNSKKTRTTNYYLPTINLWNNAHHNAMPISEYEDNSIGSENFKEKADLKSLKLFEGDNSEDVTLEPNIEDPNNDHSSIYLASNKLDFNLTCKNKSSYLAEERQYIFSDQRLGSITPNSSNISQAIIS